MRFCITVRRETRDRPHRYIIRKMFAPDMTLETEVSRLLWCDGPCKSLELLDIQGVPKIGTKRTLVHTMFQVLGHHSSPRSFNLAKRNQSIIQQHEHKKRIAGRRRQAIADKVAKACVSTPASLSVALTVCGLNHLI